MSGYGKLTEYQTPALFKLTCEACGMDDVRCFQVMDWNGIDRHVCFICLAGYHVQFRSEQEDK